MIDIGETTEAHPPCCPPAEAFDAEYETPEAFPPHGRLHYPYHESDPAELSKSLLGAQIKCSWVLPYAHKVGSLYLRTREAVTDAARFTGRHGERAQLGHVTGV